MSYNALYYDKLAIGGTSSTIRYRIFHFDTLPVGYHCI